MNTALMHVDNGLNISHTVYHGNQVDYVFSLGGAGAFEDFSKNVHRWDTKSETWTTLNIEIPEKCCASKAVICGEYLHVIGGYRRTDKNSHWIAPLQRFLE